MSVSTDGYAERIVSGAVHRTRTLRLSLARSSWVALPELGLDLDVAQEHLAGHDHQGAARQEEQQAKRQGQRDRPV